MYTNILGEYYIAKIEQVCFCEVSVRFSIENSSRLWYIYQYGDLRLQYDFQIIENVFGSFMYQQ